MSSTDIVRRVRRRQPLALASFLLVVAGCAREPAIVKTPVTTLPAGYRSGTLTLSEDGNVYAYVESVDGRQRVVTRDGAGPWHAECQRPSFAPHTHRLFYWWAEPGEDGRKVFTLYADGTTLATDFVGPGGAVFSDDGLHWAALGVGPSPLAGEVGSFMLFRDGVEATRYDDASLPAFSPDGRHVAQLGAAEKRVTLYVDGVPQQGFEAPSAPCAEAAAAAARHPDLPMRHRVQYLSDGALLVLTRDADGWGIYRDGARLASYPVSTLDTVNDDCRKGATLAPGSLRTAEKATAAFWWERVAGDADLWRVVRDGRPIDDVTCIAPWRTQPPEVSADATHVAYACAVATEQGGRQGILYHDGKRLGRYDEIWGIALSKNGAHVAYGATEPGDPLPWSIYVDGEARVGRFDSTWRPRVSDDGRIVAWQAKRNDQTRGVLGINDRRVAAFDDVLWGPEFADGERVVWIIRRGTHITRLSVPMSVAERPHRRVRVSDGSQT